MATGSVPQLTPLVCTYLLAFLNMNRSRLCVDTCEHIIDMCSSERSLLRTDSYPIWCRTALVCLKWRHRSLFNLYYEVVLEHVHDLDLLLRTLREKPGLAKLVRSLTVLSGRYIPFARTPLPRLLSHGIALNLDAVLYWSNYPPHYVETHLRDFPAMVELRIVVSYIKRPPYALLRAITSFTALQRLSLLPSAASYAISPSHTNTICQWPRRLQMPGALQKLRYLELKACSPCSRLSRRLTELLKP